MGQFVDPVVSRAKFNRQLAELQGVRKDLARRGCWIVDANFPQVFGLFATPKLKPPSIVFGATIDFTNFDMWAPSVRLVDPFTRDPYTFAQLPTHFNRAVPTNNPGNPWERTLQPLMQASRPDEIPFFCIPGVREYHDHPGHSGDPWLLRRNTAEGSLYFILDQMLKYGVDPLGGYEVSMKVSIGGYSQAMIPE